MNITLSLFPENVRDALEALIDAPSPNQQAPDLSVRYSKNITTPQRGAEGEYIEVTLDYLDYRSHLTARAEVEGGEKIWRLQMGYKSIATSRENSDMSAGDIISEVNRLLDILHRDSLLSSDVAAIRGGR